MHEPIVDHFLAKKIRLLWNSEKPQISFLDVVIKQSISVSYHKVNKGKLTPNFQIPISLEIARHELLRTCGCGRDESRYMLRWGLM